MILDCETKYRCELTDTIMKEPVMVTSEDGKDHYIESDVLIKWIHKNNSNPFNPMETMTKDQVKVDEELKKEIKNSRQQAISKLTDNYFIKYKNADQPAYKTTRIVREVHLK